MREVVPGRGRIRFEAEACLGSCPSRVGQDRSFGSSKGFEECTPPSPWKTGAVAVDDPINSAPFSRTLKPYCLSGGFKRPVSDLGV